ncbi:LBF_1199 family protein [Leptospira idonii]|nr:hypothetical protein [Leptospira idonii]
MLDFFQQIHEGEHIRDWVEIMQKDEAFCDLIFEYLWLFRSESETRVLLNKEEFPSSLLLRFIYFGYGKQFISGNFESGNYFSQVKTMLDPLQSLKILSLSEEMDRDPTLKIHLLANLDPQTWEAYFDILEGNSFTMQALLGIFANLRENEIRKILLNSPTLYYYLRMMMVSRDQLESDKDKKSKDILQGILDSVHVWELFCLSVQEKFNLTEEKNKKPKERDSLRLSLVLHELVKVPNHERADILVYIKGNGAVIDEWEESTILSVLENHNKNGRFV